jgi:O-antigen/teichoic acid export membrane protein
LSRRLEPKSVLTDYYHRNMKILTQQTQKLARNISWLFLHEMAIRCIGLATALYLARVLTPAQYGALGLALALVDTLSNLIDAGTGSRATRLTALDATSVNESYAQITGMRLVLAAVLIAGLAALAPQLSLAFSFPANLLLLYSFLLLRPALTVSWAFRGLDRMHVDAIAGIGEKAIVFLGLLLLVHGQGNDLLWVPVLDIAAALFVVFWLRAKLGGLYPGLRIALRLRDWPEIARESLPLSLAALLGSLYLHGALLLLGGIGTAAAAADFLIAHKLMLTLAIVWHVISQSMFPTASRILAQDRVAALQLVANLLRYYLLAIVPVVALLALYANHVLALLFGDAYANSGPVLIVLLAALPFLAIGQGLQTLLLAIPKPRAVLVARTAGALVLLLVATLLIPPFGATGAALAVVVGEALAMCLLFFLVRQGLGAAPWNARCGVPIIAGLIAAVIFSIVGAWSDTVGLLLAAVIYTAGVWLMRGISVEEIKAIPSVIAVVLHTRQRAQDQ